MTLQITKEFVIKKIQDHIEYFDNFMKMLCKNPDISYSDEQFELDSDKIIECREILEMLECNQHTPDELAKPCALCTPESAYQAFNDLIHKRMY